MTLIEKRGLTLPRSDCRRDPLENQIKKLDGERIAREAADAFHLDSFTQDASPCIDTFSDQFVTTPNDELEVLADRINARLDLSTPNPSHGRTPTVANSERELEFWSEEQTDNLPVISDSDWEQSIVEIEDIPPIRSKTAPPAGSTEKYSLQRGAAREHGRFRRDRNAIANASSITEPVFEETPVTPFQQELPDTDVVNEIVDLEPPLPADANAFIELAERARVERDDEILPAWERYGGEPIRPQASTPTHGWIDDEFDPVTEQAAIVILERPSQVTKLRPPLDDESLFEVQAELEKK